MSGSVSILHRIRRFAGKRHGLCAGLGVALLLTFSLQICNDASAKLASDGHAGEQTLLTGAPDPQLPHQGGDHVSLELCCFAATMEHSGSIAPHRAALDRETRPLFQGQITGTDNPELRAASYADESLIWPPEPRRPIPPVYLATLRLRF